MILVDKKTSDTYFHNHTVGSSTWKHVERVKENDYLTSKQEQKNVAKIECGFSLKQTSAEF
jgi:hypothetical protein